MGTSRVFMSNKVEVKTFIPQYRICWSSYPEREVVDGAIRQVGFRLELYGTYPSEMIHASSGYLRSHEVWAALKEVARWIMPAAIDGAECEIEAFDNAIHYSRVRRNRGDVELHIRIIHKSGLGPVDQSEAECLEQMITGLRNLESPEDYYWKAAM